MVEITQGNTLEINNLLAFRKAVKQTQMAEVGMELEKEIKKTGVERAGAPISVTYGMTGELMDMEMFVPVNKVVATDNPFKFREKIKIVNALKVAYKGNPALLQEAYDEAGKYIEENGLVPITQGYNIARKVVVE